jgi:hypothetical protein
MQLTATAAEELALADLRKTPGVSKIEIVKISVFAYPLLSGDTPRGYVVDGEARINQAGEGRTFHYMVKINGEIDSKRIEPWA